MLISQRPQLTEEYIDTNRSKFVIEPLEPGSVSYTHLTLPTILLV